jgi:uncharacterized RmlC-like cupin family protein
MAWVPVAPGARQKVSEKDGKRTRLLELTQAFVEREWCTAAHVGYVLQGELEIAFENRFDRFAKGDAFVIPAGTPDQHKARSISPRTLVLLVEDL